MRLHLIKAAHGDGLLLESGGGRPARVLIDGGPKGCWDAHTRPYLESVLGEDGALDALIVSHVDLDHIVSPLDLLAELERRRVGREPRWPVVGELWHNSFHQAVDPTGTAAGAMATAAATARSVGAMAAGSEWTLLGIAEGAKLRRCALMEEVPLNRSFGGALLCPDDLPDPVVGMDGMSLRIVGPTRSNLQALRREWERWARDAARARTPRDLANVDRSVPNLSSIVTLAEEDGRRALLTGDARGDHIEQGLDQAGALTGGKVHVQLLKLQHHGSARNVDRGFFERVTADVYAVSADGRYRNPDIATLRWIVEVAEEQGRRIVIASTFWTPSIEQLVSEHPPGKSGYELRTIGEDEHGMVLDV